MLVFRLETKDGRGPGGTLIGEIRKTTDHDPWDHPGPDTDFRPGTRACAIWWRWKGDTSWTCRDPNKVFGCPSFEVFLSWFPRRGLEYVGGKLGARVKVFWVDGRTVAKSNLQVAFDRTQATLLLNVRADVAAKWPEAISLRAVRTQTHLETQPA